jgi:L-lysine exporter family protein LysE/ArgO
MDIFLSGFLLGLSLISAIGAQNAFVLSQGLRKEHVFAVCLTCALSDAVLITIGVAGFGTVEVILPWIKKALTLGGIVFLIFYAAKSFLSAFAQQHKALTPAGTETAKLTTVLMTCLAFTWLNPHVYLDTMVLIGSVSTHYGTKRDLFGLGAATASLVFFFSLGYGARLLRPLFANPKGWRVLDFLVGMIMAILAWQLFLGLSS